MLPTTPDITSPTSDNFRLLLTWLGGDEDVGAQEYERIRKRLIRIFVRRGCHEPELLADQTIERVTLKTSQIVNDYVGKADLYFYGVAKKIYLEWLRQKERERLVQFVEVDEGQGVDELECLEICLKELSSPNRDLILEYYRDDKKERILRRKSIALKMGITIGALQIRASRIRAQLLDCVVKCSAENVSERF